VGALPALLDLQNQHLTWGETILLHGIVKKTEKTPKDALDIAKERKKEVEK